MCNVVLHGTVIWTSAPSADRRADLNLLHRKNRSSSSRVQDSTLKYYSTAEYWVVFTKSNTFSCCRRTCGRWRAAQRTSPLVSATRTTPCSETSRTSTSSTTGTANYTAKYTANYTSKYIAVHVLKDKSSTTGMLIDSGCILQYVLCMTWIPQVLQYCSK